MPPVVVTEFTPFASLIGGVFIGLSAVMVMGLFGRVAGIAGISTGAMAALVPISAARDHAWRFAFIGGLVAAPLFVSIFDETAVRQAVPTNLFGMIMAGLLVGGGTALGSGCTSGHGVCGLARLSLRSLIAVATFMFAAFMTVLVLRHVVGGFV